MAATTPEQKLAAAVIHRAIMDAHGLGIDGDKGRGLKLEVSRARSFLLNSSYGLSFWCAAAGGIDPARINKWAADRQAAGWPRKYVSDMRAKFQNVESFILAEA